MIGVIPQSLVAREVAHQNVTQMHIVNSMHERKALMADLSDGFMVSDPLLVQQICLLSRLIVNR